MSSLVIDEATAVAGTAVARGSAGWWRAWQARFGLAEVCGTTTAVLGFGAGCLAGAAWLLRPLPGGLWLGFALGKLTADVAFYALEASARSALTTAGCCL